MQVDERPQLPLTPRRKVLAGIGAAMFVAQLAVAYLVAPEITGPGDANAGALAALWAGAIAWSVVAALLIVRQADMPDVATASMLLTIATFAVFGLSAAWDVRGTEDEINVVDSLFLGVTSGALTGLLVWGIAMLVARVLRLPTTAGLAPPDGNDRDARR